MEARIVALGDREWRVSVAAERRPNSPEWHLVFAFRALSGPRSTYWATYPLSATSRSTLFRQADQISDDELVELLAARLP